MTWSRPISTWLAPALILALGVAVILSDGFGIQSAISNRLFDAFQRHAARSPAAPTVKVLDLPAMDEDSLTAVTRTLAGQGARLVIFTAPLEPGPSPQSLAAKLPADSDAARAALAKLPEPGHELAQALASVKSVVPVVLGAAGRSPAIKARLTWRGTHDPFAPAPRFDSAAASTPLLEANAAGEPRDRPGHRQAGDRKRSEAPRDSRRQRHQQHADVRDAVSSPHRRRNRC